MKMFAKMPPDRPKMHQKAFGGRAQPGPPLGEIKRFPDPLAAMGVLLLRGGEEKGEERKGKGEGGPLSYC